MTAEEMSLVEAMVAWPLQLTQFISLSVSGDSQQA